MNINKPILMRISTALRATLLILILSVSLMAQVPVYKVGDVVDMDQGWGKGWVKATIEEIDERDYKVRYGPGTLNFIYVPRDNPVRIRDPKKGAEEDRQTKMRYAFIEETRDYASAIYAFLNVYDDTLLRGRSFSMAETPAEKKKAMTELAQLDAICRSKYSDMVNDPKRPDEKKIDNLPATWCDIAAKRDGFERGALAYADREKAKNFNSSFVSDIESAKDAPGGKIREEIQFVVFERDRWLSSLPKTYPNAFKTKPAAEYFKAVFAKADELKAQIEEEAPTRTWDAPTLHNPALEGYVRSYYAKYRPGVQILKIGMTMTGFKTFKNSLGIPTSQVISGSALVKVANRPFCQNQVFELKKEYLGGGRFSAIQPSYIGTEGTFVSCQ